MCRDEGERRREVNKSSGAWPAPPASQQAQLIPPRPHQLFHSHPITILVFPRPPKNSHRAQKRRKKAGFSLNPSGSKDSFLLLLPPTKYSLVVHSVSHSFTQHVSDIRCGTGHVLGVRETGRTRPQCPCGTQSTGNPEIGEINLVSGCPV